MENTYKFADKLVRISSVYSDVHKYCIEYRADGVPDFAVAISQADIDYERSRSSESGFSDGYLEELAVYRKIAEKMPDYDTFLFHGSALAVDGKCYIFTAKSGTGKSTHAKLWRRLLGDRVVMINDDKPLIKIKNNEAVVYGTPYNGKHRLGSNTSFPLKCICIIERSEENKISQINSAEAYTMLLQQRYRPVNIKALEKTLKLIDQMSEFVSFWRLGCNMDISAAELAYNTMKQ